MSLLEIKDLHVSVVGKEILKGITLSVGAGEVHAIMGPNGTGKSTLSNVIAGREGYDITKGTVRFDGKDLFALSADERARAGIFLAFQGKAEIDAMEFLKLVKAKTKELGMADDMIKRQLNVGFSGGEKKRAEVLQMTLLEPKLAILDETDSGLDIDALKIVSDGVNALRAPTRGFLVITHYQRLLDYIVPDFVHVLSGGKVVASGGKELAKELEATGYAKYQEAAA
jgi:Fe-S cluster assembly ATP-binding protein